MSGLLLNSTYRAAFSQSCRIDLMILEYLQGHKSHFAATLCRQSTTTALTLHVHCRAQFFWFSDINRCSGICNTPHSTAGVASASSERGDEDTFLNVKAKAYSIQIKDSVMTYQHWAMCCSQKGVGSSSCTSDLVQSDFRHICREYL